MKDFFEVLRQKEIDCARLRREVEALRVVAPLLDPEGAQAQDTGATETLDEMITRERAMSEQATFPESAAGASAGEEAPMAEGTDERKGPSSENAGQTSWWRRLSGA